MQLDHALLGDTFHVTLRLSRILVRLALQGAIQNMARPDPSLPSCLRPQHFATETATLAKWWLRQRYASYLTDKEEFFHDDPDVQHSSTLVTAWEANWRTPSGSTTQHGRQPSQPTGAVSLPFLWAQVLQSLDHWRNLLLQAAN